MDIPLGGFSCLLFPGRIEIWKVGFSWKEENWRTGEKPFGARTRTNQKLNPNVTLSPRIERRPQP